MREIRRIEREAKRRLAWEQRGLVKLLLADRSGAFLHARLAALRDRLKAVLLDSGVRAYGAGYGLAERRIERDRGAAPHGRRGEQFRESAETPIEIPTEWARWYAGTLDDALYRYTDRIRRDVGDLTVKAALEGWTQEELTREVRALVQGISTWQAERIARTETMRLWNLGSYGRMEEEGEDLIGYTYSVVLDDRTSHICRPLDGKRVQRTLLRYLPPLHPHCRTILEPVYRFDDLPADPWSDPESVAGLRGFGAIPKLPRSLLPMPSLPPVPPPPPPIPPAPAQPPGGGQPAPIRPVSQALQVRAGRMSAAAKHAIAIIDQVHQDGDLPLIPVGSSTSKRYEGVYRRDATTRAPKDIRLSLNASRPELTTVHEIGHFLDNAGLGNPQDLASFADPVLDPWRAAVMNSRAYADLIRLHQAAAIVVMHPTRGQIRIPLPRQVLTYLLNPAELFARSYAQYIATKSGDPTLLHQLAAERIWWYPMAGVVPIPIQWDPADFAPIEAALEAVIRGLGWKP